MALPSLIVISKIGSRKTAVSTVSGTGDTACFIFRLLKNPFPGLKRPACLIPSRFPTTELY